MTVVMSIDIGIRNLAFCIMKRERDTWNILLWDVYNTMVPEESSNICCGQYKNGKKCVRKCSMKKDASFYCKPHSIGGSIPVKKSKKVQQMSYPDIATGLLICIENLYMSYPDILSQVDRIGIELQLVKNPRMKFASHCIMTKLIDIYRLQNKIIPLTFIRASMKLKLRYDGPEIKYTVKNAYSRRKKCAIEYTRYFIKKLNIGEEWTIFLNNQKTKLDDLSDTACFCLIMLGYPRKK